MSEISPGEDVVENSPEKESVSTVQESVRKILPEYSQVDRTEYDAYDPESDKMDRGQILYFFTEQGNEPDAPKLLFIFEPDGMVLNYYNSPEPEGKYSIRNKGDSIRRGGNWRWGKEDVNLAVEKAKIHMQGVGHESDEFQGQLAGWDPTEDRLVTMGERMKSNRQTLEQKGFKEREALLQTRKPGGVWNLLEENPQKAAELAITRIGQSDQYIEVDGTPRPSVDVVGEIRQGTDAGQRAVRREINIIESQESLLRVRGLLI